MRARLSVRPAGRLVQRRSPARLALAMAAALAATTALTPPAHAMVGVVAGADALDLDLVGLGPVTLVPERDGHGVLLRFARALPSGAFDGLDTRYPGWFQSVSAGYDTALLRTVGPVAASLAGTAPGRRLHLAALPAGPTADPGADQGPLVRLDVVRAQLQQRDGDYAGAVHDLRTLDARHPNDLDILPALADAEDAAGGWRNAWLIDRRVTQLSPGSLDAAKAAADLYRANGQQVRIDSDLAISDGSDRQYSTVLQGRIQPTDRGEVGMSVEWRHLHDGQLTRADGNQQDATIDKFQGELYGLYRFDDDSAAKVSLLPATDSLGFEASYRTPLFTGQTTLTGTYHRPYWDIVQGIAEGGRVDRLELAHTRPLFGDLTGSLAARVSHYGINGDDDAAASAGFTGSLSWPVPDLPAWSPALTLGYEVDGEYVTSRRTKVDQFGDDFNPLPVTTHEIHTVSVEAVQTFWQVLTVDATAGYAVDRFSGNGPSVSLALSYAPLPALDMGVRASYEKVTGNGTNTPTTRIGGYLAWHF